MEKKVTKPSSNRRVDSAETREAFLASMMSMEHEDKLFIPDHIIPDDVEYYWVRESTLGKPDPGRMVEMRRKGWTPVPAERHPELVFTDFFDTQDKFSGYIYREGLILCERPKEYGKIEREKLEAKNYQALTSMPGTENFLGEPSIPTKFTGDTYLTKTTSHSK